MRVLIHIAVNASLPAVLDAATASGATVVRPPRAELPGLVVAVFPDRPPADRGALLEELRDIPGVLDVELDASRTTEG